MHLWGDESFDWAALDGAIDMITTFMRRWGRIGVDSKEKYGTARISVTFWDGSLHGLLYPGYHFSQFPKWLWVFDLMYLSKAIRFTRIHRLVQWYQSKVYSKAYDRAIKKYPHIKVEIIANAYPSYLIKDYELIMQKYRFVNYLRNIVTLGNGR